MSPRRDPVERAADRASDLYEIATWEPRTEFDDFAVSIYEGLRPAARFGVIVVAGILALLLFGLVAIGAVTTPLVGGFVVLSIVPALLFAVYIYRSDVTTNEPLRLVVGTFLLAILFSTFASVVNTVMSAGFRLVGIPTTSLLGGFIYFFFIVGPGEEFVKWLAIRMYPFRRPEFDAVIDGAVYGAIAGLGFATIENAVYITSSINQASTVPIVDAGSAIATVRAFAGPGHVIYSAIAGFYLGLAKFNREYFGPIVVKGLLLASLFHATYNMTVSRVPQLLSAALDVSPIAAFFGYVVVYDTAIGLFLYRKIRNYRRAYDEVGAQGHGVEDGESELTEFDQPPRY
ncbi:PrsW family intramembrane metalloprotease [Haloarchaeobius amylolyticus]|uniref:PrsW family intramembrane metalloprotease n=1 Tax=Haloarchaeobius amylolyticus TaxID=1198296 RepID=UPI00226D906F|nr:PrsW family intramembrane metalloprotease [Haloarchaeobius amylolyticus]